MENITNQCPLCDGYYTMRNYKSVQDLDEPKNLGICPKCRKKKKQTLVEEKMKIDNFTQEQVEELAGYCCPKADGFEGPETFPDCEECIICLCQKKVEEQTLWENK